MGFDNLNGQRFKKVHDVPATAYRVPQVLLIIDDGKAKLQERLEEHSTSGDRFQITDFIFYCFTLYRNHNFNSFHRNYLNKKE